MNEAHRENKKHNRYRRLCHTLRETGLSARQQNRLRTLTLELNIANIQEPPKPEVKPLKLSGNPVVLTPEVVGVNPEAFAAAEATADKVQILDADEKMEAPAAPKARKKAPLKKFKKAAPKAKKGPAPKRRSRPRFEED